MGGIGVAVLFDDAEIGEVGITVVAEEQALAAVGDENDAVVGDLHRALLVRFGE
jgi:hypothetical protein